MLASRDDADREYSLPAPVPKRPLAVMDLRAVLNDVDEDIFPGRGSGHMYKRNYSTAVKTEPIVELHKDVLIDRTSLLKDLRRTLKDTNLRIERIGKELSELKTTHGEELEKFESVGDTTRVLLKNRAALELQTKQTEKRAARAGNEEARLAALFEKLTVRTDDADKALLAKKEGRDEYIGAETQRLKDRVAALEKESTDLRAEVEWRNTKAEEMRMQYQTESASAAELCREVDQLNAERRALEKQLSGEAFRLKEQERDLELGLYDDEIGALKQRMANLEEVIRRLDLEQQRRLAKFASRQSSTLARRTRSPATSSLSRGCSPATISNSAGTTNHTTSGHPLQYSQKV